MRIIPASPRRAAAVALAAAGGLALAGGIAQASVGAAAKPAQSSILQTVVTAEGEGSATAQCPAGCYATGGGFTVTSWSSSNGSPVFVNESHPTADGNGWYASLHALDPGIIVYADCIL